MTCAAFKAQIDSPSIVFLSQGKGSRQHSHGIGYSRGNIPTSTGALGCNCTDVATPGSMWGLSPHLLGDLFQCIQSTSCFLLASLMNTELSRSWANVILCRTCKYSTCSRLPHDRTEPTQPGEGLCLCTEICPLCSMLPLTTFPDVRERMCLLRQWLQATNARPCSSDPVKASHPAGQLALGSCLVKLVVAGSSPDRGELRTLNGDWLGSPCLHPSRL